MTKYTNGKIIMMNAQEEFLHQIKGRGLLCATISFGDDYDDEQTIVNLPLGYTRSEYALFLDRINREYDDGYGGQELFGMIWHTETTWSDRGEYDGSEWWRYNSIPEIPKNLTKTNET